MNNTFGEFEQRELDACSVYLRTVGGRMPQVDAVDIGQASWADLHQIRSEARKASRRVLKALEKPVLTDEESRKGQSAHDVLMAIYDFAQDEMDRRDSFGQREPLTPEQTGRPLNAGGEARAFDDGGTASFGSRTGWADRSGTEIRVLAPSDSFAERSRHDGPGLGAVLRALVTGPRNDAERRALSEGTDSAGGYTVPTPLAAEFIDRLRAASVCIRAGARTVPLTSETLSIARLETDPTMAWRAENAAIGESDPTFGRVQFQARSLAGLVRVSRELLEDSVNIEAMLMNAFVQQTAVEFDRGCLYGSGSSDEPTGIGVLSGVTEVSMGTNGGALADFDEIIDTIYAMQLANAGDPSAMIYHPRTAAALAKLKDANSNPLSVPEMVAKVPKLATTSVPIDQTQGTAVNASSVLVGDYKRMLIGLRSHLRIEVLKERYADSHQYGFVAFLRGDVQVEHKAAFAKLVGIIPA